MLTLPRKPPGLAQQLATQFKHLGLTQLSKIKLIQLFSHSWWRGCFHLLPVAFLLFNMEEMSFSLCNMSDPSWGTNGTFRDGSRAWLPMRMEEHPFTCVSLFFLASRTLGFLLGWYFSFSPCHRLEVVSCLAAVLCLMFLAYPRGGCRAAGLSAAVGCYSEYWATPSPSSDSCSFLCHTLYMYTCTQRYRIHPWLASSCPFWE